MIRHVAIGEIHVGDRRDREMQTLVKKLLEEKCGWNDGVVEYRISGLIESLWSN